MRLNRFVKRAALVVILSAAILVAGVSAYLRIEQYRFRKQAEELLSNVRQLELKKASAADVSLITKRWRFEELQSTGKACTDEDCEYYFRLIAPDPLHLYDLINLEKFPTTAQVLAFLGQRPGYIQARLRVHGRVLRSTYFAVGVLGRQGDSENCTLMGFAGANEDSSFSEHDLPDIKLKHSLLHPTYLVGTFPTMLNVDTFQASPATVIWAEFLPDANNADVSRLMQFDLRCFTTVRRCKDRDLMPNVWAQSVEDSRESPKNLTCTPELKSRVARLADLVVLVRPKTVALRQSDREGWPPELENVEIVSVIRKPKNPHHLPGPLFVAVESPELTTSDTHSPIRAGQQYLFLLQHHQYRGSGWIALYPCGILTPSASNLAMVREAAANGTE
jgi:hypothetical protein